MRDRIGRLEARRKPKWTPDPELSVATSAICKDVDAYHRELEGLPPSLPLTTS